MTRLSPADRYKRDLEVLDIPASVLRTHMKKAAGKEGEELEALLRGFAETAESIYPYRRGKDPRHRLIGAPLEERGINPDNWLQHIGEMTDREISYMLDQEPGTGRRNEERIVHPESSDRELAEFMRDFGL